MMTDHESSSSPSFMTTVPAFSTTAKTITRHKARRTERVMLANALRCCVNSSRISISSSDRSDGSFSKHSRTVSRTVKLCVRQTTKSERERELDKARGEERLTFIKAEPRNESLRQCSRPNLPPHRCRRSIPSSR